MKPSLYPMLALIAFAAADARAGTATQSPVAEIVTFHLNEGVDEAAFLTAAAATESFLRASGHVLSRSLSRDETGQWTDYILWTNKDIAMETAEKAMKSPDFAPFMSMISPEGTSMRHAAVLYKMD